ncbi:MAG: hypothetical protein ACYC21_15195 [Eubacteriales bacterium]
MLIASVFSYPRKVLNCAKFHSQGVRRIRKTAKAVTAPQLAKAKVCTQGCAQFLSGKAAKNFAVVHKARA